MASIKFKPADSYEGLRKQASALVSLVDSLEKRMALLSKENAELRVKCQLNAEVEAERNTNAYLTDLIESMENAD